MKILKYWLFLLTFENKLFQIYLLILRKLVIFEIVYVIMNFGPVNFIMDYFVEKVLFSVSVPLNPERVTCPQIYPRGLSGGGSVHRLLQLEHQSLFCFNH